MGCADGVIALGRLFRDNTGSGADNELTRIRLLADIEV